MNSRKIPGFAGRAGFALLLAAAALDGSAAQAAKVTKIEFSSNAQANTIKITSDGPITFDKQENSQDKQIVVELKGAQLTKASKRKLDTSSFKSKVSLISPYQVEGQADTARVVIQLREMASAEVAQSGNVTTVTVPNDGAGADAAPAAPPAGDSAAAAAPAAAPDAPPAADAPPADPLAAAPPPADDAKASAQAAGSGAPGDKTKLDSFIETQETRVFNGKPITLQVRDADLSDVLRLIGEASGFNVVIGDDVRGRITLSLVDVPWDQALDVVLHTRQLGAERNHNILRVVTLASLTAEKQAEITAKRAAEAGAARVTRMFPISYGKLDDLKKILKQFGNTAALNPGQDPNAANANSVIESDERTNAILVRDTIENVERMKKLIELLDSQTPQIMIEAKIVEATESFAKSMQGNLGFGGESFVASFAGANPLDPLVGAAGTLNGPAAANASAPSAGGKNGIFGATPKLSFLPGVARLNAFLSMGENESQLKVVATPKTVVLNKQQATITQQTPVLVPSQTTVSNGVTTGGVVVQNAVLNLTVTPTATNNGAVVLDLNVSRDVPFALNSTQTAVAGRNMKTNVVVESGTTLVIGGIYTLTISNSSEGFPILRKIPILGALFGDESESTNRSELFIFVTPRIINEAEAGLLPAGNT